MAHMEGWAGGGGLWHGGWQRVVFECEFLSLSTMHT